MEGVHIIFHKQHLRNKSAQSLKPHLQVQPTSSIQKGLLGMGLARQKLLPAHAEKGHHLGHQMHGGSLSHSSPHSVLPTVMRPRHCSAWKGA